MIFLNGYFIHLIFLNSNLCIQVTTKTNHLKKDIKYLMSPGPLRKNTFLNAFYLIANLQC